MNQRADDYLQQQQKSNLYQALSGICIVNPKSATIAAASRLPSRNKSGPLEPPIFASISL